MACPTTFTLGGVNLPVNIIWQDREAFNPVAQSVRRTLGGKVVVFTQTLIEGRPITLASISDQGWMLYPIVQSIQALADVAGTTYSLVIDSTTYTVVFRHEESPAFVARPLISRILPDATDWFLVTIKLMTV